MFDWVFISDFIATVAGFIVSIGSVAGVIYKWVWKPYVNKREARELKKEAKEERYRQQMIEISKQQVKPVSRELQILAETSKRHDEIDEELKEIAQQNVAIIKEVRDEFKEHNYQSDQRDKLISQNAQLIKNHDERLDQHADRILILETVSGLKPKHILEREGVKK